MRLHAVALTLLLTIPCAARADVFLPASERAAASPPVPGTGLDGFYWRQFAANNEKAREIAEHNPPDARFRATSIDYPNGPQLMSGRVSLAAFLGVDGRSLQVDTRATDLVTVFRFRGYLNITEAMDTEPGAPGITVVFALRSDDGAQLRIGGETVISRNGANMFTISIAKALFSAPGLYPVDLVYYENFDVKAGIEWYSSIPGGPAASGPPEGTAGIVPASALYPLSEAGAGAPAAERNLLAPFDAWTPLDPTWTCRYRAAGGGIGVVYTEQAPRGGSPSFAWASVYRFVTVNLDRTPILAVRVPFISDDGWADVIVEAARGERVVGRAVKSASIDTPGLILFDIPRDTGLRGKQRLRLRLNAAGTRPAGAAEFAWARFVRREEVPKLRVGSLAVK